jgi:hypothetical protein
MLSAEPPTGEAARPGSSWNPCGVEARYSGKHARQVTAMHHGQLAVHIREADCKLMTWWGECGMGGFAGALHGPRTEPPQGFKRDRAECIPWTIVVGKAFPALVGIQKSSSMAMSASGGPSIESCQGACYP